MRDKRRRLHGKRLRRPVPHHQESGCPTRQAAPRRRRSALPVTRSKMNRRPCLVNWATAGIVWPSRRTSISDGRRRQVVVPVVVMGGLEEPLQLAGGRVERQQRRPVEIRAQPIAAIEVRRRSADRNVGDAALLIDRDEAPCVRPRAIDPLLVLPRAVVGFAGLRHGVENPHHLAGPHIPGADITRRSPAGGLLRVIAGDDEIPVDGRGRGQRHSKFRKLLSNTLAQIDLASLAEP